MISSLIAQAQIVNIPDANFKSALISEGIDTNNDSEIQVSEALATTEINISNLNISDLTGIEEFSNLEELNASGCQLTSLNLTNHSNLEILLIPDNQISNINLVNTTSLHYFVAHNNLLTSIDLSDLINLNFFDIRDNQLSSLDISNNQNINTIVADDNQISTFTSNTQSTLEDLTLDNNILTLIDLNNFQNIFGLSLVNNDLTSLEINNPNLNYLDVSFNQLSTIIFNANNIVNLNCTNNLFNELDLSNLENFDYVSQITINNNPNLQYINLKNGRNYIHSNGNAIISFYNLPSLQFVCLDSLESPLAWYVEIGSNAIVTEYCTFTPGGDYFTISGNIDFDLDNNGCGLNDINFPNLNIQISDGTTSGAFFSYELGEYIMPIQSGNYTISPQLENPTYFSISPPTFNVNFPTDSSPYTQDFCVTPNGVHNDLEVTIMPLEVARPGFDTNYKLIYKNKGNTTLSGNIDFTFDDDYMDLLTSNPIVDSQSTGNLIWNYTNLQPFETREISFAMSLNTPADGNFPLNSGDFLNYSATINPITSDETPDDNTISLNQEVVNSYDPNDKICLEGETVTPDQIGKYVHYLVRFENTGSANAVNVVVKDIIDTTKYNLLSLVPLNSSHDFYTRIRNGNEVEFIFENIQLPFDDANNDGYILFKIKTLPTLNIGDSFSNKANIYFDYNAPIITNNETTFIQDNLNINDFNLSNVKVYPNPTADYFKIENLNNSNIKTIELYNISGKKLKQFSISEKYDISNLSSGVYFIKIKTERTETNRKLIKL